MMDKQGSKFVFECDCCNATLEDYAEDSFQAMIQRLKDEGWRVTKNGSDWMHLCPQHKNVQI